MSRPHQAGPCRREPSVGTCAVEVVDRSGSFGCVAGEAQRERRGIAEHEARHRCQRPVVADFGVHRRSRFGLRGGTDRQQEVSVHAIETSSAVGRDVGRLFGGVEQRQRRRRPLDVSERHRPHHHRESSRARRCAVEPQVGRPFVEPALGDAAESFDHRDAPRRRFTGLLFHPPVQRLASRDQGRVTGQRGGVEREEQIPQRTRPDTRPTGRQRRGIVRRDRRPARRPSRDRGTSPAVRATRRVVAASPLPGSTRAPPRRCPARRATARDLHD